MYPREEAEGCTIRRGEEGMGDATEGSPGASGRGQAGMGHTQKERGKTCTDSEGEGPAGQAKTNSGHTAPDSKETPGEGSSDAYAGRMGSNHFLCGVGFEYAP